MKLIDHVTAIYNFDIDECISDFKVSFNDISKLKDSTGIHTFTFSSYDDNKVVTELLFCSMYEKTVIFYSSQMALELSIGYKKQESSENTEPNDSEPNDPLEFEILGGEIKPIGGNIIDLLSNKKQSDAYYIGRYNKSDNIIDISDEILKSNLHEIKSLILSADLRDELVQQIHPDIELVTTKVIDNTYYDIYTVPANSTFKIQQLDGINDMGDDTMNDLIIVSSHPDIIYLGDCCNSNGFYYSMYTLNKQDELNVAMGLISNEINDIDNLIIDTSELIDISVDFFNERINEFKTDINNAIEMEELPTNIDENPFSNRFFDDDKNNPRRVPLRTAKRISGEY